MGRAIWVALISMGLILLASLYADGARRNIGYQLMERRQQVLEYAQHGNWEMAKQMLLETENWWKEREERLALFTHHELTDAVGDGIAQTLLALEKGEVYELFAGLEGLKNAAERLHEQDAFVLKNIL